MRKRRFKVSVMLVLTLFLILEQLTGVPVCQAAKDAEEKVGTLYARAAVLMDAKTGRILLGKDENRAMPMASTTKIMTCILALEHGWQDDIVLVSKNAESQPKVRAGIQEGEQYWLTDLLYSLMLESHNDSAVAIAEHIAGSVEAFAAMMNEKAREIGCKTAYFITPNGLDAKNEIGIHSISAADLAKIMSYCVEKSVKAEEFLAITQTSNYSFSEITGKRMISCVNHNSLLTMRDDVISGKTGFTGDAGYCYVGAAKNEGKTFVVAVLACGWPNNKTYKWKDCSKLLDYGKEQYVSETFSHALIEQDVPLEDGVKDYVKIGILADEVEFEILKSADENLRDEVMLEALQAPVEENDVVGKVTYYLDDEIWAAYDVVAKESVEKRTFAWAFANVLHAFCQV